MGMQKNSCVLVDANFLVAYIDQKVSEEDKSRIEYFFSEIEKSKSKIIIPMPAFAEYLVGAETAGIETLNKLEKKSYVSVEPFCKKAAFECSLLDRSAINSNRRDKKDGVDEPWQKVKIDRQIIAIGKVHGVSLVISSDVGVKANATRVGLSVVEIAELPMPEEAKQISLGLDSQT